MSGWLVFGLYAVFRRNALSGRTQEGTSAHMIPCMRHKLSVSLKEMGDCPHCRVAGEPREGEQEGPHLTDEELGDEIRGFVRRSRAGPAPDIARELRLTASRLRDPEYRWSVDPAAVLERLAEKLEKEG